MRSSQSLANRGLLGLMALAVVVTAAAGEAGEMASGSTDAIESVAGSDARTPRFPGLEGGPAGAGDTCEAPASVCQDKFLFGLSTPDAADMGDTFTGLESSIDQRADLVGSYQDFTEPFYVQRLTKVVASGRTPLVTWEPFRSTDYDADSFPLASIAAGTHDRYLKRRADELKTVPGQVIVRFGHEMNGFWYPWGQPRPLHPQNVAPTTNTPARYVAAYRHVVDVFRAAGVTNAVWMWSPNLIDGNPEISLASLYPGSNYVDVVGLSGYFATASHTYANRYPSTLAPLDEFAASKPIIVAETGVVHGPGRETQLRDLVTGLANEPQVVGMTYFSQPDSNIEYELTDDPSAAAALGDVLDEEHVGESTGTASALANSPLLETPVSTPLVGDEAKADFSWRGLAQASTVTWFSCPSATFSNTCDHVGRTGSYLIRPVDRGRYLFARHSVASAVRADSAMSRAIGPVKANPPVVPVNGIDLLADATRVRFGAAAAGVTNWIVTLDGQTPVYLPSSTSEYFIKNLAAGSTHTVTVTSCDCPYKGPSTTYTFGVVTKPPAATVTPTGAGSATVALPAATTGQTGWLVLVDGQQHSTPATTVSTVSLTGLAAGTHVVAIARIAGDGRTSTASTTFTAN